MLIGLILVEVRQLFFFLTNAKEDIQKFIFSSIVSLLFIWFRDKLLFQLFSNCRNVSSITEHF